MWAHASTTDQALIDQTIGILVLNFMFYTLTLASISWVAAGFCIYRETFNRHLFPRSFSCSAEMTVSVLTIPFLCEIWHCFVLLGVMAFSVLFYLKDVIVAIVLFVDVMKDFRSEALLMAKLMLSRRFVMSRSFVVFVIMVIVVLCGMYEVQNWIRAVILEIGLFGNGVIQAHCFLLRRKYGGVLKAKSTAKATVRKIVCFVTPVQSNLVILRSQDGCPSRMGVVQVTCKGGENQEYE
jgi:hypothetical protein